MSNANAHSIMLVLGFYDRKNIGDECYKIAFKKAIVAKELVFVSMDDATQDTITMLKPDTIIIGGGDIVNDYFMNKAKSLLANYRGRVYGISIGIPFSSCKHHLDIFDHVYTRSTMDSEKAIDQLGEENVTPIVDLSCCLITNETITPNMISNHLRVGICLAQPVFYNNIHADNLMLQLIRCLLRLKREVCNQSSTIEWVLLPFNHNTSNTSECDVVAIQRFVELSKAEGLFDTRLYDYRVMSVESPLDMLDHFKRDIDLAVCMRYHSVMFSCITGKPFVALYTSSKIKNCLQDLPMCVDQGVEMTKDPSTYLPMEFDEVRMSDRLISMMQNIAFETQLSRERRLLLELKNDDAVKNIQRALEDKVTKTSLKYRPVSQDVTFADVVDRCIGSLSRFCEMSRDNIYSLVHQEGVLWVDLLPLGSNEKTAEEMARLICFCVSKSLDDPCYWGMLDAINTKHICLLESLDYIWKHHTQTLTSSTAVALMPRDEVLVNVDPHITTSLSCLATLHRSGWGHVMRGLLSLDAKSYGRKADVIIDTFVDRTFHWSCHTLEMFGVLPFRTSWFGFVHHTFDTSHSKYNCVQLFENNLFLESLNTCRGLIAMSSYLADQLRNALKRVGRECEVYTICHAMEVPELKFDMRAFRSTADRSIVQIGAWLREPYSFYALDMSGVTYGISKKALKGKNMDLYFPPMGPGDTMNRIQSALCDHVHQAVMLPDVCREHTLCRDAPSCVENKFLKGMCAMLSSHLFSVETIEMLSNEEYDILLSRNIVFLNLVDCSAVNTVLECIVRNTPLIVNRHPAIVELLGDTYPGFYDHLHEVVGLCDTFDKVEAMSMYLTKLDKTKYDIKMFLKRLKAIITGTDNLPKYDVLDSQQVQREKQVFINKFTDIYFMGRYLPPGFLRR